MSLILFEVHGRDPRVRYSPYGWRVRMALKHKHLDFITSARRLCDPQPEYHGISSSFIPRDIPVIGKEGGGYVCGADHIFRYLDKVYPQEPLFASTDTFNGARFINAWVETQLAPALSRIFLMDFYATLDLDDQAFFRIHREKRLGMRLEDYCNPLMGRVMLEMSIAPMRQCLHEHIFLNGDQPGGMDYIVFGFFMWARIVGRDELFDLDDPISEWEQGMLSAFDDYAGTAKCAYGDQHSSKVIPFNS